MNDIIIPVFFNTDNNYAVPTYITLFSMLYNYSGTSDIYVYLLTADDFSDKNKQKLKLLSERFKQVQIKIINVNNSYNNATINLII